LGDKKKKKKKKSKKNQNTAKSCHQNYNLGETEGVYGGARRKQKALWISRTPWEASFRYGSLGGPGEERADKKIANRRNNENGYGPVG